MEHLLGVCSLLSFWVPGSNSNYKAFMASTISLSHLGGLWFAFLGYYFNAINEFVIGFVIL